MSDNAQYIVLLVARIARLACHRRWSVRVTWRWQGLPALVLTSVHVFRSTACAAREPVRCRAVIAGGTWNAHLLQQWKGTALGVMARCVRIDADHLCDPVTRRPDGIKAGRGILKKSWRLRALAFGAGQGGGIFSKFLPNTVIRPAT